MKKTDYYYSKYVGKLQNSSERLLKCIVPTKSKGLIKKLNVSYGDDKQQKLDIFYDPNRQEFKRPIFFYIHGGGFVSGVTALRRPYCANMAKQGFFVVNIDYRLAPKVQFPNTFNDLFKAMDFILNKSDEYNLDTTKIVLGGESAGAYFASFITAMTKVKELYEQFNIDFQWKNEFKVSANVLINGAYSIENIIKARAPFKKTFVKAFFDLTNRDLKDKNKINEQHFNPLNFVDESFPYSVVIRGKHDVFDLGTKELLETFDRENIKYSLFEAKGVAGLHAVTIIPIFKETIKSQEFTIQKLKESLQMSE